MYNVAFNYLCDKYGKKLLGYTKRFEKNIAQLKVREKTIAINNATDEDKIYTFIDNNICDIKDRTIVLLLKQYHYGIAAKKELESLILDNTKS